LFTQQVRQSTVRYLGIEVDNAEESVLIQVIISKGVSTMEAWKSRTFVALATLCVLSALQFLPSLALAESMNGAAGQMPAYYDGQLFTVNMKELPSTASASTIAQNPSINQIFTTKDLDEEQEFFPVIDAIQGDGFNPLWQQILIVFNPGFAPRQFVSDEEVDAAADGPNPEITLVPTDEVYRCSVIGRKEIGGLSKN